MPNIRTSLLLFTLSALFTTGCQYVTRSGGVRVWSDYNTLAAPGFFFEELDSPNYRPHYLSRRNWIDNRYMRPPRFFQDVRATTTENWHGANVPLAPQDAPAAIQPEPALPPFPVEPPVEQPGPRTPTKESGRPQNP